MDTPGNKLERRVLYALSRKMDAGLHLEEAAEEYANEEHGGLENYCDHLTAIEMWQYHRDAADPIRSMENIGFARGESKELLKALKIGYRDV